MFKNDVYASVLKDASTVKGESTISKRCFSKLYIHHSIDVKLEEPLSPDHHRDSGELNADSDTDRGMEEKVGASLN